MGNDSLRPLEAGFVDTFVVDSALCSVRGFSANVGGEVGQTAQNTGCATTSNFCLAVSARILNTE